MNAIRTNPGQTVTRLARLAVLVAGLACLLCFPWNTPLTAGRLGCLVVGVRTWVVALALVTAAAVWVESSAGGVAKQGSRKSGDRNASEARATGARHQTSSRALTPQHDCLRNPNCSAKISLVGACAERIPAT
jgi:hypothetical protein